MNIWKTMKSFFFSDMEFGSGGPPPPGMMKDRHGPPPPHHPVNVTNINPFHNVTMDKCTAKLQVFWLLKERR